MDLRDQFAMAAAQGLLAGDDTMYRKSGELLVDELAKDAYKLADAMFRVKKATPKKEIPVPKGI